MRGMPSSHVQDRHAERGVSVARQCLQKILAQVPNDKKNGITTSIKDEPTTPIALARATIFVL
jgi:hypothetical protein